MRVQSPLWIITLTVALASTLGAEDAQSQALGWTYEVGDVFRYAYVIERMHDPIVADDCTTEGYTVRQEVLSVGGDGSVRLQVVIEDYVWEDLDTELSASLARRYPSVAGHPDLALLGHEFTFTLDARGRIKRLKGAKSFVEAAVELYENAHADRLAELDESARRQELREVEDYVEESFPSRFLRSLIPQALVQFAEEPPSPGDSWHVIGGLWDLDALQHRTRHVLEEVRDGVVRVTGGGRDGQAPAGSGFRRAPRQLDGAHVPGGQGVLLLRCRPRPPRRARSRSRARQSPGSNASAGRVLGAAGGVRG